PRYPAGPPTRRFVVFTAKAPDGSLPAPDPALLVDGMTACGAAPVYQQELSQAPGSSAGAQEESSAMLNVIQHDGTTIICLCQLEYLVQGLMPVADSQHRTPEWLITEY